MAKKKINTDLKPNKVVKTVKFFLSVVLILVLGYVILNYVPFIAKYEHYVIATNSMEPVINVDDVVFIDSSTELEDLETGQIIAFYADINGDDVKEIVVHYLYSIEVVDGENVYRTKPHVSDRLDEWSLSDDDIIGTHSFTIKNIGGFLRFATSTIGRIILIIDIIVIYLVYELLFNTEKKTKKDTEENINDNDKESIEETE